MVFSRPVRLHGRMIGGGKEPLTCTPLVGGDEAAVWRELELVLPKRPDLVEWRIDCFAGIGDLVRMMALARTLRDAAGETPILLTRRSVREGGMPIAIDEAAVFAVYAALARARLVDLIDVELSCGEAGFAEAVALARETGTSLVASFHDFEKTPAAADLLDRFAAMEKAGADMAKIAVMPREPRDVLVLMEATLAARERLSIPVIGLAMGPLGVVSRMAGWLFGSSITFAVGEQGSAPGQIPLEQLDTAIGILRGAFPGE